MSKTKLSSSSSSSSSSADLGSGLTTGPQRKFDLAAALREDMNNNIKYFESVSWTRHFLEVLRNPDPAHGRSAYEPVPLSVRTEKPDSGEDAFFGTTIHTESTVSNMLALRRKGLERDPVAAKFSSDASHRRPGEMDPNDAGPAVIILISLARRGLAGYPAVAHGGLLTVLFDELMAMTSGCYGQPSEERGGAYKLGDGGAVTANLNVDFKKPVSLPQIVVFRGSMVRKEGRKTWVEADIVCEKGEMLAKGKTLWIAVDEKRFRL